MIGLNGGLLGGRRTPLPNDGPGVWTANEQAVLKRSNAWVNDPSFSSVSLLLHMDGNNGSTTFNDSSSNSLAVTANGNAQLSTAQSKFSGSSALFDGAGDYLSVPHSSSLNLSSGDFTIELWVYMTTITEGVILNKDGVNAVSYPQFRIEVDSSLNCVAKLGNGNGLSPTVTSYSFNALSAATWTHLAICRTGTTIKTFNNGVNATSASQGVAMTDGGKPLLIGYESNLPSQSYFEGYIDDLRITKGVARYTANFTAPTAPFPNA